MNANLHTRCTFQYVIIKYIVDISLNAMMIFPKRYKGIYTSYIVMTD